MIGIFKQQVVEFTQDMDHLYEKKEYENLGKLAHKAKSSISIMGLKDLAVQLKTFENLAKAGIDPQKYPEYIANFKAETNEAVCELEDVLENIDNYL